VVDKEDVLVVVERLVRSRNSPERRAQRVVKEVVRELQQWPDDPGAPRLSLPLAPHAEVLRRAAVRGVGEVRALEALHQLMVNGVLYQSQVRPRTYRLLGE
jgi:hypothetical protein